MLMIIEGNRIKHNFNMAKSKCSLIIREGINYVMGYPLGNDLLTYNEFIDEISKSTSINYIESLMTTAMGDFYVFCNINNHIYVISSLGCSGLFYNLENGILYLSDSIEEIIKTKHTKTKFNDMEIIDALIYGMPNPFTTIENNIKRLSPASTLIVNKSRTCKIYGYLQYNTYEQYSTPYNSKQFDESMQIIERKLREKKSNISIMYSGGIDSAALICAFKKLNIVPIIYILEKDIKKASTRYRAIRFCEQIGLSAQIIVSNVSGNEYPTVKGLGSCVFSPYTFNIYNEIAKYNSQQNMSDLLVSGESMDVLLGFGTMKRRNPEKYYRYIKECYKRYFHSKQYQNLLGFFSNFNSNIIDNYLYSFLFRRKYSVPNLNNINFPNQLIPIWNEYLEYKKDYVLKPIFPYGFNYEDNFNDIGFITNRNAKIIKFYTYVSAVLENIRHVQSEYNMDVLLPYAQGPVLKHLLNYQLKLSDVFFPKQFLLDYIKQKTGINYLCISTEPIQNLCIDNYAYLKINQKCERKNNINFDIVLDNIESYELKNQISKLLKSGDANSQISEKINYVSELMSAMLDFNNSGRYIYDNTESIL